MQQYAISASVSFRLKMYSSGKNGWNNIKSANADCGNERKSHKTTLLLSPIVFKAVLYRTPS